MFGPTHSLVVAMGIQVDLRLLHRTAQARVVAVVAVAALVMALVVAYKVMVLIPSM